MMLLFVVAGAAVKQLLQMKLFIKLKLFKNYVKYVLRGSFIVLLSLSHFDSHSALLSFVFCLLFCKMFYIKINFMLCFY